MDDANKSKTIEQALTLALLYEGSWEEVVGASSVRRSWKGFDFNCLDSLADGGLLSGNKRNKSVYLTDEGLEAARRIVAALEERAGSQLVDIMREVSKPQGAYLLKVEFDFEKHVCWREIWVPTTLTFFDLHFVIQSLLNWLDYHLFDFRVEAAGGSLKLVEVLSDGDLVDDFGGEAELVDVEAFQLRDVFVETDVVRYSYDYGDGWEMAITVMEHDEDRMDDQVVCVAGAGDNPPDDVGGEGGFSRFLQAINDSSDPEHARYIDWGGQQGYFEFSLEAASKFLSRWQTNKRIHQKNVAAARR